MENIRLSINDRVEIQRGNITYKSKVQSMTENEIFIDSPLYKDNYLILQNGEIASIITYIKQSGVYKLDCKVLEKFIEGNVRGYKLSKPHEIKKIQRRNFVRVKITRIIKCLKEDNFFDALLLDLSGGGMLLKSAKNLKVSDEIVALIKNGNKEVRVKGKVVRIEDSTNAKYDIIGVEFVDLKNSDREAIIQIVFEIMRKQMELI